MNESLLSVIWRNAEALRIIESLVEQIDAYRNGWLGEGAWRNRIGLDDDLQAARKYIVEHVTKSDSAHTSNP